MFISEADVDGGVETRQSKTTLLLSNLQAGYSLFTGQSETLDTRQSIVTEGELGTANTSSLSKKTL